MNHPPSTVQQAFKLANDVESQLQVVDSFKLEFFNFSPVEVNEMSAEESSGDEFEVNEMPRGEVRNGATVVITNVLITAIVTVLATGPSSTNLRTTNKVNLGHRKVGTPKSL